MEIKSVIPKLRGTSETIEYVCPHCGTTRQLNSPRAESEENRLA